MLNITVLGNAFNTKALIFSKNTKHKTKMLKLHKHKVEVLKMLKYIQYRFYIQFNQNCSGGLHMTKFLLSASVKTTINPKASERKPRE